MNTKALKKFLSASLAAILIALSPGLSCYEALAANTTGSEGLHGGKFVGGLGKLPPAGQPRQANLGASKADPAKHGEAEAPKEAAARPQAPGPAKEPGTHEAVSPSAAELESTVANIEAAKQNPGAGDEPKKILDSLYKEDGETGSVPTDALSTQDGAKERAPLAGHSAGHSQNPASEPPGLSPDQLGPVATGFIGGRTVMQVGEESLGNSLPTLIKSKYGDFTAAASVAVFSYFSNILGRQLGSLVIKKYGHRGTALRTGGARLAVMSTMVMLLATGRLPMSGMYVFQSLNGFLRGISQTNETSVPKAALDPKVTTEQEENSAMEKYSAADQWWLETIGVSGPIMTGLAVAKWGFVPALVAFPVSFAIGLAILHKTLRFRGEGSPQGSPGNSTQAESDKAAPGALAQLGGVLKEFSRKVAHGAAVAWSNPVLRYSFLGYTALFMFNPYFYSVLAPGHALALVARFHPELAAKAADALATSIGGWITGFYSLGGLIGALLMMREQKIIKAGKEAGTIDEAKEAEMQRGSVLRWTLFGTAALALIATLSLQLPTLGAVIALPKATAWLSNLTLAAAALIPFGMAQVVSMLKLRSLFQVKVAAKEDVPDAMSFFGAASMLATVTGLLSLKHLFHSLPPGSYAPFTYLNYALVPAALFLLFVINRLKANTSPKK